MSNHCYELIFWILQKRLKRIYLSPSIYTLPNWVASSFLNNCKRKWMWLTECKARFHTVIPMFLVINFISSLYPYSHFFHLISYHQVLLYDGWSVINWNSYMNNYTAVKVNFLRIAFGWWRRESDSDMIVAPFW